MSKLENGPPADRDTAPDLEATRSILQSRLEAQILHEALLAACRAADGAPLSDDDATRMVHAAPVDEDTTSLEPARARLGEEETTTEDAAAALIDDEVTPLRPAAPASAAPAFDTGPTDTITDVAPPPVAAPPPVPGSGAGAPASRRATATARPPLVSSRPRRGDTSRAPHGSRPADPDPDRRVPTPPPRRPRWLRRDVLVLVLLAALFIGLFWAAATAPTGASPPRSPSPPSPSS